MWAYIIAAARGDSRQTMARNPEEYTFSYRDGQVFMVSGPRMDEPGPSGVRTKEIFEDCSAPSPKDCTSPLPTSKDICSSPPFSRDLRSPPVSSNNSFPLKSLTSPNPRMEDVIEICDDEVSAVHNYC
ncbi:uncharacterized protein LOC134661582 [Cydia amplana]|uniref:uncharacterized protein LOC134661582 n=1 Tax=Cydia amplana TaxID=1869771 RepID=UPI002FE608F7